MTTAASKKSPSIYRPPYLDELRQIKFYLAGAARNLLDMHSMMETIDLLTAKELFARNKATPILESTAMDLEHMAGRIKFIAGKVQELKVEEESETGTP